MTAHVAETGDLVQVKNRPGNVHDSKQAVGFVREGLDATRARLGPRVRLDRSLRTLRILPIHRAGPLARIAHRLAA